MLEKDPTYLSRDPKRQKALANFVSFIKAQGTMAEPDHALGFSLDDREYAAKVAPFVELPPLLRSQEFLGKIGDPRTYGEAVRMIEKENEKRPADKKWIVLPYQAQFIRSVDQTTYGRLLVMIPRDRGLFDKWVQFAIATPGMKPVEIQSVSIVSVLRGDPKRSKVFFMDYFRRPDPEGQIALVPTMNDERRPSTNCYNCHKSGVVPIHPLAEFRFDERGCLVRQTSDTAEELNKRILLYGAPDYTFLDTSAYGPSLGPLSGHRDILPERVKAAMNCAVCHTINFPQAVRTQGDQKAFKSHMGLVQSYVENGWMPPNNDLSPAERRQLWQNLLKEYFDPSQKSGLLIDWLKGNS